MRRALSGFTLIEVLIATVLFTIVGMLLFSFGSMSMSLVSRNLATNHSHNEARLAGDRLIRDLHDSASLFTLLSFDGTAYSDVLSPTRVVPSRTEPVTGRDLTNAANGLRFWRPISGPCRLTQNATLTSTQLTFDIGTVQLAAGDRVLIPLIASQFTVVFAVPSTGLATITLDAPVRYEFENAAANNTIGYFFRSTAYTVWNGQIRYHPSFVPPNRGDFTIVRRAGVTSVAPFSFLWPIEGNGNSSSRVRISLETQDGRLSARRYGNSTTTFKTVISPLNIPARISRP